MRSRRLLPPLLAAALAAAAAAASPASPGPPAALVRYLAAAEASNLALRRETLDLDAARARLDAARARYQPRLDLVARYSQADGGRSIDIPVGDLLNPVYGTLNDLLGAPRFPTLANESIPLLRSREQETKLRLVQPLYRPEIARGVEAARAGVAGREAALQAFRRELRLEVERAYYRWLQARAAVAVLAGAQALVDEALRVNRSLAANGAATDDAVLRATAEVMAVRQQAAAAAADADLAQSWFNFLLNRTPDAPIDPPADPELADLAGAIRATAAGAPDAAGAREELAAAGAAVRAATAAERAARAAARPSLSLAVESGLQGESYRLGSDNRFTQASLVAEWNLFDGRENRSRVREAAAARHQSEATRDETARQTELQARNARRRLAAALVSLDAADARRQAARGAFDVVAHREREGLVNQLGFTDARNALTTAELNYAVTRCALFIAYAEYDRALALSPLP